MHLRRRSRAEFGLVMIRVAQFTPICTCVISVNDLFCIVEALKLFCIKPKPTKNVCIKMPFVYYVCVHIQMHFRLDFIMDANTMKIKKSDLVLYFTVDSQYLG